MDYNKVFQRIYERANYARVEDRIDDLAQALDGDGRETGYGIARNAVLNKSDIDDLQRLEDKIDKVSDELEDVSKGVSDYETTLRKSQIRKAPQVVSNYYDYSRPMQQRQNYGNYTQKIIGR